MKLTTLTNNYATINDGALLLRLAHIYSVGDHPTLSKPVTVDLAKVFNSAGLKITSAEETQLTATMPVGDADKRKFEWSTYDPTGGRVTEQLALHEAHDRRIPFNADALTVTLRPMEVRTFLAHFA